MTLSTSTENQPMMDNSSGYKKTLSIESISNEDLENNNNNNVKNKKSTLYKDESAVQYSSNSKGVFAQCLVTGAVLLLATGGGMPIGYSAILLPQLFENNGTMHVDSELGSWIASVHSLATPIGSLLSGPILDTIGRRSTLQLSAIPISIGWLFIGFAKNVTFILVGRVICGLSVGLMAVPSQVLVTEMADSKLRGFLVVGSFASYCFGILLVYILGATFNWDIVAFCGIVLPVLAFIALCFVPESPAWLVSRKKIEKARRALLWLRGGDMEQTNTEVAILSTRLKTNFDKKPEDTSLKQRIASVISTIRDPSVLKPFIILNVFNVLQLISGTYIIVFYAVDMIKDIGGDNINNYLAAVVTAVIRFVFSIVSCVLLLKVGRRTVGIVSALGTSLASFVLAGYMFARKEDSSLDPYVLAVFLLLYVSANTVGLLTLPPLMIGELMPLRARGIGGGFIFFLFNLFVFFSTKCFPSVNNAVGITGVFIIFGVCALLVTVFIYVALPETKNYTLEEIEDYFKKSNFLWITRTRAQTRRNIVILNDA